MRVKFLCARNVGTDFIAPVWKMFRAQGAVRSDIGAVYIRFTTIL